MAEQIRPWILRRLQAVIWAADEWTHRQLIQIQEKNLDDRNRAEHFADRERERQESNGVGRTFSKGDPFPFIRYRRKPDDEEGSTKRRVSSGNGRSEAGTGAGNHRSTRRDHSMTAAEFDRKYFLFK
jgi:hypothetical protein